jgi:hypothetical protein
VLTLGLVAPAIAADVDPDPERASERDFSVYHGPVAITLANPDSDGHQVGDLRVTSTEISDEDGAALGRLEASLITTAIDTPAAGDEIRIGTLVFTFGDVEIGQIVVDGSAHYPADGPTIAVGDTTVRPVVGGSGRFAGASGEAITAHLEDGTWVHEFDLRRAGASRAEDRSARAERSQERQERKAERKQARDDRKAGRESGADGAAIDSLYTEAAADQTGVVRTDLGVAEPGSASGQELGLWHYTINVGAELAPHTHPGTQLARVTAGELEYSVISGEGRLLRADGSVEAMGPGTYVLATGDGVIENPELVHFGANRTDEVVTLISATLYPADAPLSTLIEEPDTSE